MRVLILGGGGTLGAFSAGALRTLAHAGWNFDACIGSSAGSINLLRYLAGGPDAPAAFWTSLRWTELAFEGLRRDLLVNGLLDPMKFNERVDAGVDYARLLADPRPVGFIVVDLGTGKVSVRGNRTESDVQALREVAHASYAVPPLLPPVRLGTRVLADGGLLQNAPLEAALKLGATEIVYLCNVQVLPRERSQNFSDFDAAVRYMEIFFRRASNVGFADAHITGGRYHDVPFLTIAPPTTLALDSLLRWMLPSRRAMSLVVHKGEELAREALLMAANAHRGTSAGSSDPAFAHTNISL